MSPSSRFDYRLPIGFGIASLVAALANLVFYLWITHRWYSLAVAIVAAGAGVFAIRAGLGLRRVRRELGRVR